MLGFRFHRTPSEITVRIHRGVRNHLTLLEITVRIHRTQVSFLNMGIAGGFKLPRNTNYQPTTASNA